MVVFVVVGKSSLENMEVVTVVVGVATVEAGILVEDAVAVVVGEVV